MNVLNQPWKELFELPDFGKVKEEDFLPALTEAISLATQNLERISNTRTLPDFFNTIEALETFDEVLSRLSALFFNLVSSLWRDIMSGLVKRPFFVKLFFLTPRVPIDETGKLFSNNNCLKKSATELFPLVPVTAIIFFGFFLKNFLQELERIF